MPSDRSATSFQPLPRWLRLLVWTVVMAVLLGVFALYTRGDIMLTLADQVWACF